MMISLFLFYCVIESHMFIVGDARSFLEGILMFWENSFNHDLQYVDFLHIRFLSLLKLESYFLPESELHTNHTDNKIWTNCEKDDQS